MLTQSIQQQKQPKKNEGKKKTMQDSVKRNERSNFCSTQKKFRITNYLQKKAETHIASTQTQTQTQTQD